MRYLFPQRKSTQPRFFLENLREFLFPNYVACTCVNDTYSGFKYRFVEARIFIVPPKVKKVSRVKANAEPDIQVMSAIPRKDKLYKKFKHFG